MIAHEDVEDDAHWIKWLRHAAQVHRLLFVAPKAPRVLCVGQLKLPLPGHEDPAIVCNTAVIKPSRPYCSLLAGLGRCWLCLTCHLLAFMLASPSVSMSSVLAGW